MATDSSSDETPSVFAEFLADYFGDEVHGIVERAAGSDISVLLTGESGTGKEVLARALHARSRRSAGPFVAIHTTDSQTVREIAPFAAAGVVQTAGAVMFLAGLISEKKVLVRDEPEVAPVVSGDTVGLTVSGAF